MRENYSDFQVGNWVVYLPGENYCTIKSLLPELILQGALKHYDGAIEDLGKIAITRDKLQVCGFDVQHPSVFMNFNHTIPVAVARDSTGAYKVYKNDEPFCKVQFIHEVQNAYFKITGEELVGNLYGVQEG